jgi:hypothetical protein
MSKTPLKVEPVDSDGGRRLDWTVGDCHDQADGGEPKARRVSVALHALPRDSRR